MTAVSVPATVDGSMPAAAAAAAAASTVAADGTAADAFDVAIVGSGIVGLGAALAAADRGLRVVVIDRSAEVQGATVRNFGHLCVTPQAGFARALGERSREIWLRLAADADVWVRESGTFVVARHEDELRVLQEFAERTSAASGSAIPATQTIQDPLFSHRGERQPLRALGEGLFLKTEDEQIRMLDAETFRSIAPVAPASVVGGAWLPRDLQANPRQAASAIQSHLRSRGVEFRMRTAVTGVRSGAVETTRGSVTAGTVVVAVNHDIDQLYPEVAERLQIRRCGLDMMRVRGRLRAPLHAPLLTGWSMLRYGAFAELPSIGEVRERLTRSEPVLAALDLNLMTTQLPDGSLIVGDTHYRGEAVPPFQSEHAFQELLRATGELFGTREPRVIERWQGVYASAPQDFLVEEPEPGVHFVAATTGIGMTTGLALGEHAIDAAHGGSQLRSVPASRAETPHSPADTPNRS
ncbi:FAD-dependent oxidoreductase [Plantibacter sp. YIM 135347]|uniref:FAD-dependent oxidoreductase n=1 Tax=Plantibacter sp. YIM 135347 TaxID=3423919 RepID=UPI003D32975F